jgi:nucleotide-binding universal stress UspA family protein
MYTKILVGYDGSSQSEDALCLAKGLAATMEGVLVMTDVKSGSAAQGLREMADADSDDLIVVGSSHRGRAGTAIAGTVGVRLLDGAPCPVAVAPPGLAEVGHWRPATIGVAFDGSAEAYNALEEARRLAIAAAASLEVIAVAEILEPANQAVDPDAYRRESEKQAQEWLGDARAALPTDFTVVTRMLAGNPGHELLEFGHRLDLLVVGSRGHGPVRRVLQGSVSTRLIGRCPCPLIVTPRGSRLSPAGNYVPIHGSPRKNENSGSA